MNGQNDSAKTQKKGSVKRKQRISELDNHAQIFGYSPDGDELPSLKFGLKFQALAAQFWVLLLGSVGNTSTPKSIDCA